MAQWFFCIFLMHKRMILPKENKMSKVMKYDALADTVNSVEVYPAGKNFSWEISVDNLGKIK